MSPSARRLGGASFVETLIVIGLIGSALVGAFMALGSAHSQKVQRQGDAIAALECVLQHNAALIAAARRLTEARR